MDKQKLLVNIASFLFALMFVLLWNERLSIAQEKPNREFYVKFGLERFENYGTREYLKLSEEQATLKLKSEGSALRWSLAGTLVPLGAGIAMVVVEVVNDPSGNELAYTGLALSYAGVVVGPSLGYFYGGRSGRGWGGIGIRTGLGAVTFVLAVASSVAAWSSDESAGVGEFLIISGIGSALMLGHAIYDIASVKSAVRKRNESQHKTSFFLIPKYFASSGAGGVELKVTF